MLVHRECSQCGDEFTAAPIEWVGDAHGGTDRRLARYDDRFNIWTVRAAAHVWDESVGGYVPTTCGEDCFMDLAYAHLVSAEVAS